MQTPKKLSSEPNPKAAKRGPSLFSTSLFASKLTQLPSNMGEGSAHARHHGKRITPLILELLQTLLLSFKHRQLAQSPYATHKENPLPPFGQS